MEPLIEHLKYISNKKNIWYTAFGYLCLYHFLEESTILFEPPKIVSTPITSIIVGQSYVDTLRIDSYPEPKYYINHIQWNVNRQHKRKDRVDTRQFGDISSRSKSEEHMGRRHTEVQHKNNKILAFFEFDD